MSPFKEATMLQLARMLRILEIITERYPDADDADNSLFSADYFLDWTKGYTAHPDRSTEWVLAYWERELKI